LEKKHPLVKVSGTRRGNAAYLKSDGVGIVDLKMGNCVVGSEYNLRATDHAKKHYRYDCQYIAKVSRQSRPFIELGCKVNKKYGFLRHIFEI
jgi:hypothetical protein